MSVVDDYLASIPEPRKAALGHVRQIVNEMAPEAEDCTSYNIPAFRYKGKIILGFLAWKNHLALYPFTGRVAEQMRDKLTGFKISAGSGAIHFSETKPIPDDLLREIIQRRINDIGSSG